MKVVLAWNPSTNQPLKERSEKLSELYPGHFEDTGNYNPFLGFTWEWSKHAGMNMSHRLDIEDRFSGLGPQMELTYRLFPWRTVSSSILPLREVGSRLTLGLSQRSGGCGVPLHLLSVHLGLCECICTGLTEKGRPQA